MIDYEEKFLNCVIKQKNILIKRAEFEKDKSLKKMVVMFEYLEKNLRVIFSLDNSDFFAVFSTCYTITDLLIDADISKDEKIDIFYSLLKSNVSVLDLNYENIDLIDMTICSYREKFYNGNISCEDAAKEIENILNLEEVFDEETRKKRDYILSQNEKNRSTIVNPNITKYHCINIIKYLEGEELDSNEINKSIEELKIVPDMVRLIHKFHIKAVKLKEPKKEMTLTFKRQDCKTNDEVFDFKQMRHLIEESYDIKNKKLKRNLNYAEIMEIGECILNTFGDKMAKEYFDTLKESEILSYRNRLIYSINKLMLFAERLSENEKEDIKTYQLFLDEADEDILADYGLEIENFIDGLSMRIPSSSNVFINYIKKRVNI